MEVDRLQTFGFGTLRFVRDPLVLNCAFVTLSGPADNERDLRVLAQVPRFPGRVKSIEKELESSVTTNPTTAACGDAVEDTDA